MAKDDKRDQRIERRMPITEIQKRIMMTILIRKLPAFLMAKSQLKPSHFNKSEQGYAIMWAATLDYYEEMGQLPREHELIAEIDRRLREDPDCMTVAETEDLNQFILAAFHAVKRQHLNDRTAAKHLRTFLEDRLADEAREIFHLSLRNPSNIFALTNALNEQAGAIKAIAGYDLEVPFPEGWDKGTAPVRKWSTRMSFFDHFLLGGDSPGEVYGLMAPYGTCKTTTGVHMSTQRARFHQVRWRAAGKQGPLPIVYYFFWEGTLAEFRVRALSSLGKIDRGILETGEWDKMSYSKETLREYERALYIEKIKQGEKVNPETVRKRWAEMTLNVNWRPVDMTGNDPTAPSRGCDLVDGMVAYIRQDQMYRKGRGEDVCVGGIYADYLLAMADAYITHEGLRKKDELRFIIKQVPLHAKNRLAIPFQCPVWIIHQLSGDANSMAPGVIPKVTDSAEGKAFAENLDFCFQYGGRDENSRVILACGKARRAPPQSALIVQIHGRISRVEETKDLMVVDPVTKRFVPAKDLRKVEGGRHTTHTQNSAVRTQFGS